MTRDYRRGALPAEDYRALRADIAEELQAADAERARLAARADELAGAEANLDANDETLRRFSDLRAAIQGRVTHTSDIGALRAALTAVFEFVAVLPQEFMTPSGSALLDADAIPYDDELDLTRLAIVPAVREDMLAEATHDRAPEADVGPLRRVPVTFDAAPHGEKKCPGSGVPEYPLVAAMDVLKATCGWKPRSRSY